MRTRGFAFMLLGSLESVACVPGGHGGQSGGESTPIDCGRRMTRSVGPDEETPAGSARDLFQALSSPQSAPLHWESYGGMPLQSDTTVTLSVSGSPSEVTYSSFPDWGGQSPSTVCGPSLRAGGAVLHFETADGTFDESIPGAVSVDTSLFGDAWFEADAFSHFNGTYDASGIAARFGTSDLYLESSFWPAIGSIGVTVPGQLPVAVGTSAGQIATWEGTDANAATGGTRAFGGSPGTGAAPGIGGDAGGDASTRRDANAGSGGSSATDASAD